MNSDSDPNLSTIVLASNNAGKLREFRELLAPLGLEVIPQGELGVPEAEETGLSFVENAILKARNAARHTGLPAIADDSGLEVDYLGGEPGIHSARYAEGGDAANIDTLLANMAAAGAGQRAARFQCVLVYLAHATDPTPLICQGTWEGEILDRPHGKGGFGYDPVFLVPDHGRSAAELAPETKNRISHRARASRRLVAALGRPR